MQFAARFALAVALLTGASPTAWAQGVATGNIVPSTTSPIVVELYTSQGCSSCPAADALLGRIADRDDVIALSMSVDYWDYLGWKDTLASPKFSERQRAYRSSLGVSMVYTPMMVVNGAAHINGADERKLARTLEQVSKGAAATNVPIHFRQEKDNFIIEAGAAPQGGQTKDATLWLAVMSKSVQVPIERGENRGKTITYRNVVQELIPVGAWSGRPIVVQLERHAIVRPGAERCAVLLQQGKAGPILGAAMLKDLQ
jgi:hypothetical protein